MVRELYTTSALVASSVTLLSAVKVFSHVGKVLGSDGRVAWLKAARRRKWRLWGPATASAAWKDRKSTPRRPTDSPQRQAPFFTEDSDALQFWASYRARMSPKWGSTRFRSSSISLWTPLPMSCHVWPTKVAFEAVRGNEIEGAVTP